MKRYVWYLQGKKKKVLSNTEHKIFLVSFVRNEGLDLFLLSNERGITYQNGKIKKDTVKDICKEMGPELLI